MKACLAHRLYSSRSDRDEWCCMPCQSKTISHCLLLLYQCTAQQSIIFTKPLAHKALPPVVSVPGLSLSAFELPSPHKPGQNLHSCPNLPHFIEGFRTPIPPYASCTINVGDMVCAERSEQGGWLHSKHRASFSQAP
jgi:hypothetical protein